MRQINLDLPSKEKLKFFTSEKSQKLNFTQLAKANTKISVDPQKETPKKKKTTKIYLL